MYSKRLLKTLLFISTIAITSQAWASIYLDCTIKRKLPEKHLNFSVTVNENTSVIKMMLNGNIRNVQSMVLVDTIVFQLMLNSQLQISSKYTIQRKSLKVKRHLKIGSSIFNELGQCKQVKG